MSARRGTRGLVPLTDEVVFFTYARVSSDDQEKDGMSLPVQDDETLGYGARHAGWTFGGKFVDVQTGANPTRRDYLRLKAAAGAAIAAGKRAAIICVMQTRLGRNVEEAAKAWRELDALGIEMHGTRDGGRMKDWTTYMIRAVMAERDLQVISEGVSNSFARAREHGWLKPGRPSWGYRWEKATDVQRGQGSPTVVPVPHDDEAPYVRELFRRRAAGASFRELAEWVRSLPASARGAVRRKDGSMLVRELHWSAIGHALSSPVYVARNPEPGVDVLDVAPGKWEPLIDDATWRAIHPRTGERENPVSLVARSEYVLTGYLFCEVCGARMCGSLRRGRLRLRSGRRPYQEPDRRVYVCTSRMKGASWPGPTCSRNIDADVIEFEVLRTFGPLLKALADPVLRAPAQQAARELERRASSTGDARRLLNYEQDRQALIEERNALTIAVSLDRIPQDAYMSAVESVAAKLAPIEAEIERLRVQQSTARRRTEERPLLDVVLQYAAEWQWSVEQGGVTEQRAFLSLVVDRATPRRVRPGVYHAGLQLTALGRSVLEVGAVVLPIGEPGRVEDVQRAWANCTPTPRPESEQRASA